MRGSRYGGLPFPFFTKAFRRRADDSVIFMPLEGLKNRGTALFSFEGTCFDKLSMTMSDLKNGSHTIPQDL
ncbi:MAG: hypothetical protein LC729_00420 [Acidobacteria bacterium]|nr:hypothetical protein [Acidobacteriota bacterium]